MVARALLSWEASGENRRAPKAPRETKNRMKTITLNATVRAIVTGILNQQPSGAKKWGQAEHGVAVAKAVMQWTADYAKAKGKVTEDGKERDLGWKDVLARYGEHGFLGGNISQFQQTLDSLPADDACYVKRPVKGQAVADYK